jgi:hypothetical protein
MSIASARRPPIVRASVRIAERDLVPHVQIINQTCSIRHWITLLRAHSAHVPRQQAHRQEAL